MENEKLDQILNVVLEVKKDVAELKVEMKEVKADVAVLKAEMKEVKADVAVLKTDVAELKAEMKEVKADVAVLKTDVVKLKVEMGRMKVEIKDVKEIAMENRTDFMLTKEYIEKRDKEFKREKIENEKFKTEQQIQTEAATNRIAEIAEELSIDKIKIEKLFALETAAMLARQAY